MTDTHETHLRYVSYAEIEAYEALGWRQVPVRRAVHHDAYSRLMEITCEGDPVEPTKEETAP